MKVLHGGAKYCVLWLSFNVLIPSFAEAMACYTKGMSKEDDYNPFTIWFHKPFEEMQVGDGGVCSVDGSYKVEDGQIKITFPRFLLKIIKDDDDYYPKARSSAWCRLDGRRTAVETIANEEALLRTETGKFKCICNTSAICATQPEVFEEAINSYNTAQEKFALRTVAKWLREGLMPNNATRIFEQFRATTIPSLSATTTLISGSTTSGDLKAAESRDDASFLEQNMFLMVGAGVFIFILLIVIIMCMRRKGKQAGKATATTPSSKEPSKTEPSKESGSTEKK